MQLELKSKGFRVLPQDFDGSNVDDLQLWDNKFTTIPESVLAMPQLRILNLGNNPIARLPEEMSALVNLEKLTLYLCPLINIPDWLATLPRLEFLWFSNHKNLTSVSPKIGSMPSLQRLLIANDYTENELGRYLKEVERFCGQMNPTSISNFTKLYFSDPQAGWDALETEEFGEVGGRDGFIHRVTDRFSAEEPKKKLAAFKLAVERFIEADGFFADRNFETAHEQKLKADLPARRAVLLTNLEDMRPDLEATFPRVIVSESYDVDGHFLTDHLKYPHNVAVRMKAELDKAFRVLA